MIEKKWNKSTNYIVSVFNVIGIIAFCILYFSIDYIFYNSLSSPDGYIYIYDNFIVESFIKNIEKILLIFYLTLGISNIVSFVQNRKNKKLSFWYFVFGAICIAFALQYIILKDNLEIIKYLDIILFVVIPILITIKNFIYIKKYKPTKIKIFSYIFVIIISILELFSISFLVYGELWIILSVIMQFIYIHIEKNIEKTNNFNKVIDVIIHYLLHALVVVMFLILNIYAIIITKMWDNERKNQVAQLIQDISLLKGNTKSELYIPVEKDKKYGFINEDGEEKIACEYDKVTYFYSLEKNNEKYYFSLAKKGNNYYVISKSGDKATLDSSILSKFDNLSEEAIFNNINKYNYKNGLVYSYIETFDFSLRAFISTDNNEEIIFERQDKDVYEKEKIYIEDEKNLGRYYYKNENYLMLIEPLEDEEIYASDDEYFMYSYLKCRVTVKRADGEETSEIEYIQGSIENSEIKINMLTDGYIPFRSLDGLSGGWYDSWGYRVKYNGKYEIEDVRNGKIILIQYNSSDMDCKYFVFDSNGTGIIQTLYLVMFDNYYWIIKENGKCVLMNSDFNQISEEYDGLLWGIWGRSLKPLLVGNLRTVPKSPQNKNRENS